MGFLSDCLLCFTLGITGEYNRYLQEEEKKKQNTPKVVIIKEVAPDPPHYIIQQVEALTDQIETNNALIYRLDERIAVSYDHLKVLDLEKKRHKLAYDTARLEEKRYKLIEKYNLED